MKYVFDYRFTPVEQKRIMDAIKTLDKMMSMLIQLTPDQRSGLNAVADGREPFVNKANHFITDDESTYPDYRNVEEFKNDHSSWKFLREVGFSLRRVNEKVNDTCLRAGAEAFDQASMYYDHVQIMAKNEVPGTDTIVEELGKLYPGRGPKAPSAEEEKPENGLTSNLKTDDNGL